MISRTISTVFAFAILPIAAIAAEPSATSRPSPVAKSPATQLSAKTFMVSKLTISRDIGRLENDAFICDPVQPLKKDDTLALMASDDQAWSVAKHAFDVDGKKVDFPVMGMVKGSDGNWRSLVAATIRFKRDMKAGDSADTKDYHVKVERAVKADERMPAFFTGHGIFSIEVQNGEGANPGRPVSVISKQGASEPDVKAAIEASRVATDAALGQSGG